MKYVALIEIGDDATAYGIHIPDLDVYTAGDTLEDAYIAAAEAADIMLQNFMAVKKDIPTVPTKAEVFINNDEYKNNIIGYIDIDVSKYLGKSEKINVTLPSNIITSIDNYVKIHNEFKSRSNFLLEAAIDKLAKA